MGSVGWEIPHRGAFRQSSTKSVGVHRFNEIYRSRGAGVFDCRFDCRSPEMVGEYAHPTLISHDRKNIQSL
jgi:hypothetical protein